MTESIFPHCTFCGREVNKRPHLFHRLRGAVIGGTCKVEYACAVMDFEQPRQLGNRIEKFEVGRCADFSKTTLLETKEVKQCQKTQHSHSGSK